MTAAFALRGDDERLFAPGGRVRADKVFPLKSSQGIGLRVLDGREPEHGSLESPEDGSEEERNKQLIDDLYEELDALIARADAFEKDNDTAKKIAEIEARLFDLHESEAVALQQAFETGLVLPPRAGAAFAEKVANVRAEIADLVSDDPASDDRQAPAAHPGTE